MIKMIGGFEDIGEAAHEAGQVVANQTKKQTQSVAKTAAAQITGGTQNLNPASSNQQGTNEQGAAAQQQMNDDQAKKFLQDLYGPSNPQSSDKSLSSNQPTPPNQNPQNVIAASLGFPQDDPNKGKSPEELVKIESLRKQLHGDYYESLTRPKQEEESVTEKLEREEQQEEMAKIEEEKKKTPALSPTQKTGTGEAVVGVAG